MASGKQHFCYGAATGAVVNAAIQLIRMERDPSLRFDWGELGCSALMGGVVAGLPDLIEPAVTPNHRGIFHSAVCGAMVLYAAHGAHTAGWSEEGRTAARVAAWAYVSHLFADALTPKSIRFC